MMTSPWPLSLHALESARCEKRPHTRTRDTDEGRAFGSSSTENSTKLRPARHHHHERPSHTTLGSRRNPERAAKRGQPQLRSQTASACQNQYRWKVLRVKVPGKRRGPSS